MHAEHQIRMTNTYSTFEYSIVAVIIVILLLLLSRDSIQLDLIGEQKGNNFNVAATETGQWVVQTGHTHKQYNE